MFEFCLPILKWTSLANSMTHQDPCSIDLSSKQTDACVKLITTFGRGQYLDHFYSYDTS